MEKLTRREEELMRCFWEHGPLFVRELVALAAEPKPHFNTLSTTLWMGIPKPLAPIPVFAIAIPVNFLLVQIGRASCRERV